MKAKNYIIPEVQVLSYMATAICAASGTIPPTQDEGGQGDCGGAPARKLYV